MGGTRNVRSRLMAATMELLAEGGVQAATPAAVAERAGAAKMSLYRQFEGKEQLVTESLRAHVPQQHDDLLTPELSGTPSQRLLGIFDRLAQRGDKGNLNACVYLTTCLETADTHHPVATVTREFKAGVATVLRKELTEMGHPAPEATAHVLVMLIDGAVIHAVISGSGEPLREARGAAEVLLAPCS